MKILLILPAAEDMRVTADRPRPLRRKMLRFSVLPLTVVAALTDRRHEVKLIDEHVEAIDCDEPADVVGIGFMTALAPRAFELAAAFRRRGRWVVAGGYHPTLCPTETAPHFDAVVAGEAEGVWSDVLADIEAGRLTRGEGRIYRRAAPADLADTPIPRRELTDRTSRHYVTTHAVETGRGCPHGCAYCSIAAFHRCSHRNRPLENVLEELRQIPRDFMFVDDNILADPPYARRLFAAMVPMGKRWISQCSIQIADDPELLALARAAGCRGLFIGIETLSSENLSAIGKEFNDAAHYRERLARIRRAGIGVHAGVIVGLDGDDVTVFRRTLRFLQRCRISAIQLNILTPLPGTPMYGQFREAGRIIDPDWAHYDFRHTVISPARMTPRRLQDGADWLYRQFYRWDRVLVRSLRDFFRLGPLNGFLAWRMNCTYRYENRRQGIHGRDPAKRRRAAWWQRLGAWLRTRWERALEPSALAG